MQIRPELRKGIALTGLLLAALVVLWAAAGRNHVHELRVDGQLLGFVENEASVKAALDSLLKAESEKRGLNLLVASKVEMPRASEPGKPFTKAEVENALAGVLKYAVKACVIQVNGKDVVALQDKAQAEETIRQIKASFEESVQQTSTLVESRIAEEVKFVEKPTELSEVRSIDDAKKILLRGTDTIVTHTVKKGESLWSIARDYNTTVENLRMANPDLRGDRLDIGQEINLTVATPYINVITVERQTVDVKIGFRTEVREDPDLWPWESVVKQPGVYGKKEVTYEIKRQNGREIAREVLDEKHISDPTTQIIVQGSKMTAEMGTGQFAWPVSGKISSRYGPRRSGYHRGLDIAAPTGTPVHAADSGTVVMAGYKPYYGKMIMIDHGGGKVITVYGHLSEILVQVGDIVNKGDVIGKVGATGRATGPHLHFEVRVEGSTQNPINYYPIQK